MSHNVTSFLKVKTPLLDCIKEIKCWMANKFLQLNENKIEVIVFNPTKFTIHFNNHGPLNPYVKPQARNLGVILYIIPISIWISKSHLLLNQVFLLMTNNQQTQVCSVRHRSGESHPCFHQLPPGLLELSLLWWFGSRWFRMLLLGC